MELRGPYRQILSTILSVAAAAIAVRGIAHPTPIDGALPLLALAASLLAAVSALRLVELAPLALIAAAFIPADAPRLLAYGVVVAVAFVGAVVAATIDDEIGLDRAIAISIVLVVFRLSVPASLGAEIVVIAGAVALLFVASGELAIRDTTFLLVVAVGIVAPSMPFRAALFPLVVATLIVAMRRRGWLPLVVLAAGAVIAGRWAWPLALSGAVFVAIDRARISKGAAAVIPFLGRPLAAGAAAHAAVFDPAGIVRLGDAIAPSAASVVLVGAALFSRPQLAIEYVVTALLVTAVNSKHRGLVSVPLFFTAAGVALFAWSGSVSSAFPLPLPLVILVGLAAVVAIPALPSRVAAPFIAVVALAVLVIAQPGDGQWRVVDRVLKGGSEATYASEHDISAISLSGANLTSLPEGTIVGRIQFLDRSGRGLERQIRIGDVADWAAFQPQNRFWNHNPLPYSFAGTLHGFGLQAWPEGRAAIDVDAGDVTGVRVIAAPDLPAGSQLSVEAIEVAK